MIRTFIEEAAALVAITLFCGFVMIAAAIAGGTF